MPTVCMVNSMGEHAMIYDSYPLKQCSSCHEYKSRTTDFFNYASREKDRLRRVCRECRKRIYYADPIKYRARAAEWQRNNPEKAAKRKREWEQTHRPPPKQRNHQSSEVTRQHKRDNYRRWSRRRAEQNPNSRLNRRLFKTQHPDEHKAREREQNRLAEQRRRARKRQVPNQFTNNDWQCCLLHFNGCCAYCSNPPRLFDRYAVLHADHFIPISSPNCPGTVPWNIVPACQTCNGSKHDRDAVEWMRDKFGSRHAKRVLANIETYFDTVQSAAD